MQIIAFEPPIKIDVRDLCVGDVLANGQPVLKVSVLKNKVHVTTPVGREVIRTHTEAFITYNTSVAIKSRRVDKPRPIR